MPLFDISNSNKAMRISASGYSKERDLQNLVEANLESIFGIRFIASEYTIRGEQAGRIDTLGLDTDNTPTIIEYKRTENDNAVNQGFYYLNWLVEHRGDFVVAARDMLGSSVEVNWSNPRLLVIAQSFSKYDVPAVKAMGGNIELWTYTLYGADLLNLELIYGQQRILPTAGQMSDSSDIDESAAIYTLDYHLSGKPTHLQDMFNMLRSRIFDWSLEEGDIIETPNKLYVSYRHGRNFCEIEVQAKSLKLTLDIPHKELDDPKKISRDVSQKGHWGTGETQLKMESLDELDYVLSLIEQSYRQTV